MGVKKEILYIGAAESEEFKTKYPHEKSFGRDWADAIWFAVMVASLVRMIYVEPYQIPTSSMERSLRVGDYLFVSKLHNGFRVPSTPVSIPFVHRDLFGVKSYSDAFVLPYMRFPGWVNLKSGDASVFNWPDDDPIYPTDKKMNFIKRCVAGPGDSIAVRSSILYINGRKIPSRPLEQYSYLVGSASGMVNEKYLDQNDIYDYIPVQYFGDSVDYNGNFNQIYSVYRSFPAKSNIRKFPFYNMMQINTTPAMLAKLEEKGIIDLYIRIPKQAEMLYPKMNEPPFNSFTADNCGPYYCPKRGDKIDLTDLQNLMMYYPVISRYEDLDEVSSDGQRLLIDGEAVNEYTFKYNYYWMMGDNRHNSADSRYWGFVPETHILGKPLLVLLSIQYKGVMVGDRGERANQFQKLRLDRLFKTIN